MRTLRNASRLMLALLAALVLAIVPGFAADMEVAELGTALLEAQQQYTAAVTENEEALAALSKLEAKYEKNQDDARLQDQLIEAMIRQEEAAAVLSDAKAALAALQTRQVEMAKAAECEDLIAEYQGKYADIVVTVTVDENLVIYGLSAEVDGSERDQMAASPDYLYSFIGKDLPLTIGNGKKDEVAPLKDAQQTSKDLVAALNSLVYAEEKEETPKGPIIEPQDIADYIFRYGKLPDNFITKKQAQNLGWDSSRNYVSDVAPGKSIGGDRFGNYEGLLPSKKGRTWYEADCYYTKGKRNAYRILFSNDGLVYYTDDHYESFTQMFPSK